MLTDIGLPFLFWLRNRADDLANHVDDFVHYLDSWIEHLCPCGGCG